MKWHLLVTLLLFLFSAPLQTGAAVEATVHAENKFNPKTSKEQKPSYQILKRKLELELGRKLKWSERLGLRVISKLPEKDETRKANNHALVGFILGIASLVLLPILSVPGFIFSNSALRKERLNPGILEGSNRGLAKAGQILSIIGFIYLLLVVLYIVLVISSGFFI